MGESDKIKMKNVVATINLNNSKPIKIYADNAYYNDINSNTNFYGNVLMTYNEHIINSDNLDLMLGKNLATLSNNIVYKNFFSFKVKTFYYVAKFIFSLIKKNFTFVS